MVALSARKATGSRKKNKPQYFLARHVGYFDPGKPDMEPVMVGRPFYIGQEDDERVKEALANWSERFSQDDRCLCTVGVFYAVYKSQALITRLRR